jgi:hypothetical protein
VDVVDGAIDLLAPAFQFGDVTQVLEWKGWLLDGRPFPD